MKLKNILKVALPVAGIAAASAIPGVGPAIAAGATKVAGGIAKVAANPLGKMVGAGLRGYAGGGGQQRQQGTSGQPPSPAAASASTPVMSPIQVPQPATSAEHSNEQDRSRVKAKYGYSSPTGMDY